MKILITLLTMVSMFSYATTTVPVEDYVQQEFFEGLPYEATLVYDESDLPKLRELLSQYQYLEHWRKIVAVMAIIGSDDVVDDLVQFIEVDELGDLGQDHYYAKKTAIISLGYLIHKTGNEKAITYLEDSLTPSKWSQRGVNNLGSRFTESETRNNDLARAAVIGLVLSGNEKTHQLLKNLKDKSKNKFNAIVSKEGFLDLMIKESESIKSKGMSKYYKH